MFWDVCGACVGFCISQPLTVLWLGKEFLLMYRLSLSCIHPSPSSPPSYSPPPLSLPTLLSSLLPFLLPCSEEFRKSLEQMRRRVLQRAAVKVQAVVRMFLAKKHWPQLKFSLKQAKLQGAAQQTLLK